MNKLEEEPWLPVRGIVTLFRIKASAQSRPMAWVPWCCVHLQICFERPLLTNGRSPHQVTADDQTWEVQRRYSDFHELNQRLGKAFGEAMLPELPPKLLLNSDEDIAERWKGPSTAGTSAPGLAPPPSLRAHRYLELDAYLRKLLQIPSVASNYRLSEFLGIAKQGVRYGVRNYECAAPTRLVTRRQAQSPRLAAHRPRVYAQVRLVAERGQPLHSRQRLVSRVVC